MVESDRGRSHYPHARTAEQPFVATRAGADDQRIGIADVGRPDSRAGQIVDVGPLLEHAPHERDSFVYHDFHGAKIGKRTKNA